MATTTRSVADLGVKEMVITWCSNSDSTLALVVGTALNDLQSLPVHTRLHDEI